MSKKTHRSNFNHLSGSQILSPFVTPHVGTCETLTNTFALQYSSIENGFLHKYVVGRWIAKINKVSCSYLHILQCLLALMPIFTGFIFFFFAKQMSTPLIKLKNYKSVQYEKDFLTSSLDKMR